MNASTPGTRRWISLLPLDVGFDLRATKTPIELPAPPFTVKYSRERDDEGNEIAAIVTQQCNDADDLKTLIADMTAAGYAVVTRMTEAIRKRLGQLIGASVEWTGRMPKDAGRHWDQAADQKASTLTVADVEAQLENCAAETDTELIDMAVAMAAEPDGMPEGGCVIVTYAE